MVHGIASAGRQDCGGLGNIQRTAAAEPEHRIAAGIGHGGHHLTQQVDRRLGGDAEDDAEDSGLGQSFPNGVRPGSRTAGDHQGPASSERHERRRHLADPTGAEPYVGRHREVEASHPATSPRHPGRC